MVTKMGQYRQEADKSVKSVKLSAEARILGGYPTLVVSTEKIKELTRQYRTDIIRLKVGKYRLTIEPYTLKDFIEEYNKLIKSEYKIRMTIHDDQLAIIIGNKSFATDKWKFDKEHGGAIHIIAEYPSLTRVEGKIKLKYQIKNEKAYLYIQEYRAKRKRDVPYKIINILGSEMGIILKYKHGKKVKTSVIMNTPSILEPLKKLGDLKSSLSFKYMGDKSLFGIPFEKYEINITNDTLSNILSLLMSTSYRLLKDPNFEETAKTVRDQIGKFISSVFLEKLGYSEVIKDLEKYPHYQIEFPLVKPDLIAKIVNEWHIIEVKFRFKESNVSRAIDKAYYQVARQFAILSRYSPIKLTDDQFINQIKGYGLIVLGYDHRINRGYLYFHLSKVK